jgi:hypothetical protein
VNHDLIAAGHPRLAFEYTRFHFQSGYRKHWQERTPQPEFETRAWVIGQAASLRAAVEVLHARAARAKENKSPWPEFAGFSCFACHQTIGKSDVKAEAIPGRTLGRPSWEVWYIAPLGPTTSACRELFPSADRRPLTETLKLKTMMGRISARASDVENQSATALVELNAWLAALQAAEEETNPKANPYRMLEALAGSAVENADWDSLASHYLGCAAMVHAASGKSDMKDILEGLRRDLQFPKIGGERFNNPARFDREELTRVRAAFGRLRDYIPPGDR